MARDARKSPSYSRKKDPLLQHILKNPQHPRKYGDAAGLLDPYSAYLARARDFAAVSKPGIERFAFNVFGPDLIGSLAFAIDPFRQFRLTGAKISPTNRVRRVPCIYSQKRGYSSYLRTETIYNGPDLSTSDPLDFGPASTTVTNDPPTVVTGFFFDQDPYFGWISDTTRRTRPYDSEYGEFELFTPKLYSPPRFSSYRANVDGYNDDCVGSHLEINLSHKTRITHDLGPAAYVYPNHLENLRLAEQADSLTAMSKFGFGMVKQALPAHPSYQLLYNLAELKDLPQMLRNTVALFKDLPGALNSFERVGNQYLNYKFGWESTLQAVQGLLASPQKIAKRINYLLSRRGKPTTFRSTKKWIDSVSSVPSMSFLLHPGDSYGVTGSRTSRAIEMRVALNATLDFPKMMVPEIRQELADLIWGKKLTPTDLYNLVPWTWLADWFSGLGDYLTLLDRILQDPALVNFGFITYSSEGDIAYTFHAYGDETFYYTSTGTCGGGVAFHTQVKSHHATSVLKYKYIVRKDITSLAGVKAASKPTTLSADQLAILGALSSKFTHN